MAILLYKAQKKASYLLTNMTLFSAGKVEYTLLRFYPRILYNLHYIKNISVPDQYVRLWYA